MGGTAIQLENKIICWSLCQKLNLDMTYSISYWISNEKATIKEGKQAEKMQTMDNMIH